MLPRLPASLEPHTLNKSVMFSGEFPADQVLYPSMMYPVWHCFKGNGTPTSGERGATSRCLNKDPATSSGQEEAIRPIMMEELLSACRKVGNNKHPGLDGLPNIALKHAIPAHSEVFVDLYNSCLEEGIFPTNWKKQRLALLSKGSKPP